MTDKSTSISRNRFSCFLTDDKRALPSSNQSKSPTVISLDQIPQGEQDKFTQFYAPNLPTLSTNNDLVGNAKDKDTKKGVLG